MFKKKYILIASIFIAILTLIVLKKKGVFGSNDLQIKVTAEKVSQKVIEETVSATGKIQPVVEVKISSEVSGEVIALPVSDGQIVRKGDLLVRVNPRVYNSILDRTESSYSNTKASLHQSEAQFKEAKSVYERNAKLFEKGVISRSEFEKSEASFQAAKAAKEASFYTVKSAAASVSESKENLGKTTIFSPVTGTISKLAVKLGERVLGTNQMAGTEIMRVVDLNEMEVEVDVNENDIVKIKIGNPADVEVDAYTNKTFKGIVTNISNAANNTTSADQLTNFKVKVKILKESYQDLLEGKPDGFSPFRPGMTATVDIKTKRKENVLAVPISAVVIRIDTTANRKYYNEEKTNETEEEPKEIPKKAETKYECVFVKSGNKAKLRIVKTGIQNDTYIEILSGIRKGEIILTGPYKAISKELNPNEKIKVISEKELEELESENNK